MTKPFYQVRVDFNRDGDWVDSYEDITRDVQQFNLNREFQLEQWTYPAASCDFTVNNGDHKYTPTNRASVLHPHILPGPNVRLRIGYPADTFEGMVSGDNLDGRKTYP